MNKVSVIIPAYNEGKCLEKTLKSVSHPEAEVIVVCNGCTDDTVSIAKKFAGDVYVLDEAGVSKARNFGASKASAGKLIFLDADIVLGGDTISKIISSPKTIGTCLVKSGSDKLSHRAAMYLKSKVHRFGFCTGLIFCDKDVFEKAGRFDESSSVGEDGRLLRKAKSVGSFGVVDGYVYNNMRRFERLGLGRVMMFWVRHYLFGGRERKYEAVR